MSVDISDIYVFVNICDIYIFVDVSDIYVFVDISNIYVFVNISTVHIWHFFIDIGDILFSLMMTYEDMDIQDRALFYYSLLTSATSKKVT